MADEGDMAEIIRDIPFGGVPDPDGSTDITEDDLAQQAGNVILDSEAVADPGDTEEEVLGVIPRPSINGLGSFRDIRSDFSLVFLDSDGNLFAENPYPNQPVAGDFVAGIGAIIRLNNAAAPITPGAYMDTAAAYSRIYMAFGDNLRGTVDPRQFYFDEDTEKFHYNGLGIINNSVPLATAESSTEVGDIAAGVRYAIVLHKTRTGYISGVTIAGIKKVEVSADGFKLTVTGISRFHDTTQTVPDPNVVARIVAFTQAGSSSAGPYYYIPADDFVEGLNAAVDENGNNITKTVIEDNSTDEATFTFPDEYLIATNDVTDFFDKRPLGQTATSGETAQKSVYFSKTLRRLIWCGENNDTYRVSEPDDPETYLGTTGFCEPGQGDGGIAVTAREFRGELYFLRNNGGHLAIDTSLTPSQWKIVQRWENVGPEGPWAVDVDDTFMVFAHRSGPYLYTGLAPEWIGYEISGNVNVFPNWDRINWDYAHLIYVTIDKENRCVKFGVPMDRSTKVNMEFICDYSKGWKYRRWSWDDAATTRALYVHRIMPVSDMTLGFDGRIKTAQMLHASNANDGLILYEDKANKTLNGAPMLQEMDMAYTPYMSSPGIYRLGAVDVTAKGLGNLGAVIFGDLQPKTVEMDMALDDKVRDFDRKSTGQNERWKVRLTNKGELGNFFEVYRIVLWVNLIWQNRSV